MLSELFIFFSSKFKYVLVQSPVHKFCLHLFHMTYETSIMLSVTQCGCGCVFAFCLTEIKTFDPHSAFHHFSSQIQRTISGSDRKGTIPAVLFLLFLLIPVYCASTVAKVRFEQNYCYSITLSLLLTKDANNRQSLSQIPNRYK